MIIFATNFTNYTKMKYNIVHYFPLISQIFAEIISEILRILRENSVPFEQFILDYRLRFWTISNITMVLIRKICVIRGKILTDTK